MPSPAWSQTEWKDRYVTLAGGTQKNPSIARSADGEFTIIVWEDYRLDPDGDIYAQKIDNLNGIAQWFPIDGVPVCTTSKAQRNPRAALDGMGNVLICWEDYQSDTAGVFQEETALCEIWAAALSTGNGRPPVTWSQPTRVAGGMEKRAYRPRIIGIPDGAYVAWNDTRCDYVGGPTFDNDRDVYLQRLVSATGTYPSVGNWVVNGIRVHVDTAFQQEDGELVLDSIAYDQPGTFGVVVAYENQAPDELRRICMDRLNYLGERLWGNRDIRITPVPRKTQFEFPYQIRQEQVVVAPAAVPVPGIGGGVERYIIAAWQGYSDTIIILGKPMSIHAQKVGVSTGSLNWPGSGDTLGTQVTDLSGNQVHPKIAYHGGTVLIGWENESESNGTGIDLWANTVDLTTGGPATSSGVPICEAEYTQSELHVEYAKDFGRFLLGWIDARSGVTDVYYQSTASSLTYLDEAENGRLVTKASGSQYDLDLANGVFVFADGRKTEDDNLYAQKLGNECDLPTMMHWKDELVKWTPGIPVEGFRFCVSDSGDTYIAWYENRHLDDYEIDAPGIYVQRMDMNGVPQWTNGGILISDLGATCNHPDIQTRNNSIYITWEQNGSIMLAEMDPYGSLQWSIPVLEGQEASWPRISLGDYIAFACYQKNRADLRYWLAEYDGSPYGNIRWITAASVFLNEPPKVQIIGGDDLVVGGLEPAGLWIGNSGVDFQFIGVTSFDLIQDRVQDQSLSHNPILVYCDSSHVHATRIVSGNPIPSSSVIASEPNAQYSSISAMCDGLAVGNPTEVGSGALVSWDCFRYDSTIAEFTHRVETQRVFWPDTNTMTTQWTQPLAVTGGANYTNTTPVISTLGAAVNDTSCYGIVAWRDARDIWCSSGTAIVTQCINFAEGYSPPSSDPRKWSSGKELSPQLGSIYQSDVSILQNGENSITAYWLDTRAGEAVIAGTRYTDSVSGSAHVMVIRKEAPEAQVPETEALLTSLYPNPFRQHRSQTLTLGVSVESTSQLRFRILDLLGRVHYAEDLSLLPGHVLLSVPSTRLTSLPAGRYRLEIGDGSRWETRLLTILP